MRLWSLLASQVPHLGPPLLRESGVLIRLRNWVDSELGLRIHVRGRDILDKVDFTSAVTARLLRDKLEGRI